MGLQADNPVVGGTVLQRAAIRSPNFITHISGWTISQDGSAEFNNLIVRGSFMGTDFVINSQGAFFYSGVPAFGNLIASITSGPGNDNFNNPYFGGISVYDSAGNVVELASGEVFLFNSVSGAFFATLNSLGMLIYDGPPANGNLTASVASSAGTDGHSNTFVEGIAVYNTVNGDIAQIDNGQLIVTASGAGGFGAVLFTDNSRSGIGGSSRNIAELAATDTSIQQTIIDVIAPTGTKSGAVVIFGWLPTGAVALPVSLVLAPAGSGLSIAEGTAARMGKVTLSGGSAIVANTSITAKTRILLTPQSQGVNSGFLSVSAIVVGTSFTIKSSNASDSNSVAWLLIEAV